MSEGPAPLVLIVDDTPLNVKLLVDILSYDGYRTITASSGTEALALIPNLKPDLVLLDVLMPDISGVEVCRKIKANAATSMLPVVLVTSLDATRERIKGLDAGADDFLSKPVNSAELLARVRSLLRVRYLHEQVLRQAVQLRDWSNQLEHRVNEQVQEMARLNLLKRFLSPQVAQAIMAPEGNLILKSHRKQVVVMFLDLRGFTAFSENAQPDIVMNALAQYHQVMGKRIIEFNATLERFTGDAIMAFFNDPIAIDDAPEQAAMMALAMLADAQILTQQWAKMGHEIGIGIGLAIGQATLGSIGFEQRQDYAAIGPVTNLASRLCSAAEPGQILISEQLANILVKSAKPFKTQIFKELSLKGFANPILAFELLT
jgi:adenylate cyclase